MFATKKEKIHFVGIGGIGMSAIALVLKAEGYNITGSDIQESEKTKSLEKEGIKIFYTHKAENVQDDVTAIVTSTAISNTNEEIAKAKKNKIPVVHRGEMLAEIMRTHYGIAVSGAHGKTTTTSLISQILINAKENPICIIGGNHFNLKSNAAYGNKDTQYMVCEADESDGSFLKLTPVITVVTNIDNDHLDYYHNIENIRVAFLSFISKVPFYGASFLCFENDIVKDICKSYEKKYYSYGFSENFDYYIDKSSIKISPPYTSFKAYKGKNKFIGEFSISLLGEHNILNSLASIAVCEHLGINIEVIKKALQSFEGVGRRLNKLYEKEIIIFDDYAHHPTEIKATLKSVKNAYPKRRIVAIFQPHRYSRTELLFNDFEGSFSDADVVIITDIYAAGEKPIVGISGEKLYNVIKKSNSNAIYAENSQQIIATLDNLKQKDDIIITLGAGNIVKTGEAYANKLRES